MVAFENGIYIFFKLRDLYAYFAIATVKNMIVSNANILNV